ncbi:MAG: TrmH family RNA methyltransferase [Microthrixaceae bacterium]
MGGPAGIVEVEDPASPLLDDYRHLTDAAARRADRPVAIVEGVVALRRVLWGRVPLRSVALTPARAAGLAAEVTRAAPGTPVLVAPRAVLAEVAGFDVHRGVLAAMDRPAPRPVSEVLAGARAAGAVAVAEGLSDHENVGAVFRNAAGLGLGAVLLDGRCAEPLYRRSIRVSLGWAAVLPHARLGTLADDLATVSAAGFRPLALTTSPAAVPVGEAGAAGLFDGPVALLVGAEGPGLDPATVDACDAEVTVPMAPGADSFNVATALAVVGAFLAHHRRDPDRTLS